jgi:4-amino-4-deoxy-L-arabinose transferase-like glycosyltransferase
MSAASHAPDVGARRLRGSGTTSGAGARIAELARRRWELFSLLALAAVLNLWALSINGWANEYYAAAVRSMSSSLHNFLFASMDSSGVMTVDKPPLALWVQTISVKLFGYHPLSILLPQALMGIASVALVYDLTRRRFGRVGGFVAGFALATTPIAVGIARHNNPDALLVLCCVAALWFAVRALEDGRTRWLVLSGLCVGLGFETKMAVALMVVPGIAAAYMWVAPRGRVRALRQLLAGGATMLAAGAAWPLLVALTPAADRPWVSGTNDNSILSLIFGYNGFGRLDGQQGGPGGVGGGTMFGGTPGPLRLLNTALGGQGGWLLGFAIVSGVAVLAASRLRRTDPRTGWLIAVGGAFLTSAVAFSFASGIFHPYYVSLLAPFTAALVGAGAVQLTRGGRVLAVAAVAAGVVVELVVLHAEGTMSWLAPLLIVVGGVVGAGLLALRDRRARAALLGVMLVFLAIAPTTWAFQTLGHAESGTFPAGGPASVALGGGPGGRGGPGGPGGPGGSRGFGGGQFAPPPGAGAGAAPGGPPQGFAPSQQQSPSQQGGGVSSLFRNPGAASGGGGGMFGFNGSELRTVAAYARTHGGGGIAVASQSQAASSIVSSGGDFIGIGGFSGRESAVSIAWFAQRVSDGTIRWVIADGGNGGMPSDGRTGSSKVMAAVRSACTATTSGSVTFYDCGGRASALLAAAG